MTERISLSLSLSHAQTPYSPIYSFGGLSAAASIDEKNVGIDTPMLITQIAFGISNFLKFCLLWINFKVQIEKLFQNKS